jgi:uncharacterized membrane protein YphA (DoxX/SURF4 family)
MLQDIRNYFGSEDAAGASEWVLRIGLAIVYVWFGLLKALGVSPATQLVHDLFDKTVPSFVPFGFFYPAFSWFEVLLGILFLFPKLTRVAFVLVVFHLISTALPLVALPDQAWSSFLVPTMEGQYIVKNVLIFGAALALLVRRERAS